MPVPVQRLTFACTFCKTEYPTAEAATQCEWRGEFAPQFKVGDIVLAQAGFGWYSGDNRWIANYEGVGDPPRKKRRLRCPNGDGNCFDPCCTYQFYYVVTHIDADDRDPHRPRYHLATGAMDESSGYDLGYTFDSHHKTPRLAEKVPAFVKTDAARLIGHVAKGLL